MEESDCILGKSDDNTKLPKTDDGKTEVQRAAETKKDLDASHGVLGKPDEKPHEAA